MVGERDGDGASAGVTGELVGVPVISFVFVSFTCIASVLFVCLFWFGILFFVSFPAIHPFTNPAHTSDGHSSFRRGTVTVSPTGDFRLGRDGESRIVFCTHHNIIQQAEALDTGQMKAEHTMRITNCHMNEGCTPMEWALSSLGIEIRYNYST